MKDIVVLMFSMDRAMQCDAALRSLKLNCVDLEEADVQVICSVSEGQRILKTLELQYLSYPIS